MSIRTLRPGEPIPAGEPRRYIEGRGYVRLRWHVGPNEYVEQYEHRLVAGQPDADVHHQNDRKADNRPGNLQPLTKEQHALLHGSRATRRFAPYRSRTEMEKAGRGIARRGARGAEVAEMARLYATGLSTTEVGRQVGIDASNVSRRLRAAGVEMRPRDRAFYRPGIDRDAVRRMHADGVRVAEMCRRLGVGRGRLHKVLDDLGLPRFGPGNPRMAQAGAA